MNRYLEYVKAIRHADVDEGYSSVEMSPNELYHYGVLGMHWGIRKQKPLSDFAYRIKKKKAEKRKKKIESEPEYKK